MAYQHGNNTTPSPMSMTTLPEISGADSTTSVFRMADADVVGAEEDEEEEEEVGTEEEEDEEDEEEDGVYGSYGGNRGSDGGVGYGKFGSKALGGGYGKFGGRGGTGGYGGYYGYGGFGSKGAKKNAQPSKGADSFYEEIRGIAALLGGSDYLGDADEEVRSGYYGGKGGKGSKGGYGFYEEVDSLFGGNIGAAAGGYGGVFYGGKGAKKNAQPSKGADSFYSEIQGIVALFGGSDYLGDADEVVRSGYYGGKGGKGSKGGYGRR